jgi:outer membrane receptor for ferric coprogen and ferric-rhodotorulic acid
LDVEIALPLNRPRVLCRPAYHFGSRFSGGRRQAHPTSAGLARHLDGYFVVDARVNYLLDSHWNAALGIDNLNDRKYFLFHPFPQRSVVELTYNY